MATNSNELKLIFLGDTHGFINDFEKQKELIERFSPEYVLYEQLNDLELLDKEDFESLLNSKLVSNMTSFEEVENIIHLCKSKNIKLIGIDLKNFGLGEDLQKIVKGEKEPSEKEIQEIASLQEKREQTQKNKIQKYFNISKKPILVITGSWHLRKESPLRDFPEYLLIIPTDKSGDLILGPPEDGFIKFSEVSVCKKN
ncbi:MAG: hypothetical protein KKF50_05630 [Nanoarchaeota archaeon]|nr:hypothetical protein [Nanoarchaeota archaeon]